MADEHGFFVRAERWGAVDHVPDRSRLCRTAVAHHALDVSLQHKDERLVRLSSADRLGKALSKDLLVLEDQRLLRREMREDCRHCDVGIGGDIPNAHGVVTALEEESSGGLGDAPARLSLFPLAPAERVTGSTHGSMVPNPNCFKTLTGSVSVELMRRVSFSEFGGPDVLQLSDAAVPEPDTGQIRVAVRAAGVNPVDWRIREGQRQKTNPIELPSGIGQDASGIVDKIGPGVDGVSVGDPVFGRGFDTYAEFAILTSWAAIPDGMPFEEAAGYPSVVETALRAIREVGVQPGQTLLINGASGGVGSAAVQIARARGIDVIGLAGAANQDYLRQLGAEPTTYGEGWVDRVRALGRVDAALDAAGSGVIAELVGLTGASARVVTIADLSAPALGVRFLGVGGDMFEALAEARNLIAHGQLSLPIEKTYPLAAAGAAQADSQAGHARGRRVIII